MEDSNAWCYTCGNPVENGQCACWAHVADALQQYLGMDFDTSADVASGMWDQLSQEERVYVWSAQYANDHDVPVYPPPGPHDQRVKRYADAIMRAISEDMDNGTVPVAVRSFSRLHDYTDANMYVLDAMHDDYPMPDHYGDEYEDGSKLTPEDQQTSDAENEMANLVMDEVDRRLQARPEICQCGTLPHPRGVAVGCVHTPPDPIPNDELGKGTRVCPVDDCCADFAEDYDAEGELLTDNYGNHWRQWHDAPHPADVSYDEDSSWCQTHGHTGLLAGCEICDKLINTSVQFRAVLGTVHNPDGSKVSQ